MKKIVIATVLMVSMLSANTAMSMGRRGEGPSVGVVVSIPALPSVVILGDEPYYNHSDYQYFYDNNRWYYSRSRQGPWVELPRDRYPKEIRYKGRDGKQYKDRDERDRYDRGDHQQNDDKGHGDNQGQNKWDDNRGHDNRR
jgi:hypothetical protein